MGRTPATTLYWRSLARVERRAKSLRFHKRMEYTTLRAKRRQAQRVERASLLVREAARLTNRLNILAYGPVTRDSSVVLLPVAAEATPA